MTQIDKKASLKTPADSPAAFAATLINWFEKHQNDLPWRRTRDPYAVLVSEFMLQQTQVSTVLNGRYFERWLEAFPDVRSLAEADTERVLRAWEGLGYYRRATNLQRAAKQICQENNGEFPAVLEEIADLPGVGRYTAGAVFSLAFDRPAPIVDANVARVFSRLFAMQEHIDSSAGRHKLWEYATELVPQKHPRAFNSGLMELGQKICTPSQPECRACPVSRWCRCEHPADFPKKKPRKLAQPVTETVYFARRSDDGHVLVTREHGNRRTGLYRLPTAGADAATWPLLLTTNYSITRYRVTLRCLGAPAGYLPPVLTTGEEQPAWCSPQTLQTLPMGAPFRKVLRHLLHETSMET
jgi:A/G-specific adenine glycosylase